MSSAALAFVIEGVVPSGNRAVRHGAHGSYTPSEVVEYRERLASIALCEIRRQKFRMVEYAAVTIVAYNTRVDGDNLESEIFDALQALAYPYDSRVIEHHTYKRKDGAGPRVAVRVTAADLTDTGYKLKGLR